MSRWIVLWNNAQKKRFPAVFDRFWQFLNWFQVIVWHFSPFWRFNMPLPKRSIQEFVHLAVGKKVKQMITSVTLIAKLFIFFVKRSQVNAFALCFINNSKSAPKKVSKMLQVSNRQRYQNIWKSSWIKWPHFILPVRMKSSKSTFYH